jgi:hypothetical protein
MTQVSNSQGDKFPIAALVIWPLVPLSIVAFIAIAEFRGQALFNHLNVYLYFLAIAGSALAAFILSLRALPKAIQRLKSNQSESTTFNYISVGFSILFDLAFFICIISITFRA